MALSWLRRALLSLAVILTLSTLFPVVALAHERRTVGKYTFVVGFLNEPSIQGQPNGLDLTITDAQGNPVEGAEKTLKVAIAYGGSAPKDLPLRARFGMKGKYTADVIPTRAGTYTFIFSGTINGQPVNERFESGPGRFSDVQAPATLQYPDVLPASADIAQQVQAATAAAQDASQRATLFGFAGIGVGIVGLVVALVALVTRMRTPVPALDAEAAPDTQRLPASEQH